LVIWTSTLSIIRNEKLFAIGNYIVVIFYLTNKETSKGWVCDSFRGKFEDTKGVIRSHKSKKDTYSDSQKRTKGQTIIDIVDGKDQSLNYS